MAHTTIRNETGDILVLMGSNEQAMVLAPWQETPFDNEGVFDTTRAARAGLVKIVQETAAALSEKVFKAFTTVTSMLFVFAIIIAANPLFGIEEQAWQISVAVAAVVVLAISIIVTILRNTTSRGLVFRSLEQAFSLLVTLAITILIPAATIYFFGEEDNTQGPSRFAFFFFGRILQLSLIVVASLLPVILYFLYDRHQVKTLRERLYRNLFRLDRTINKRAEIDAKYGVQIAEIYGSEDETQGRLARGTRWPVLLCAFVVTLGWIITILPIGEIPQSPDGEETTGILKLLAPQQTALTFGFLGAYFFGLGLIGRRFARGDLKPKHYAIFTVRILTIVVLSWVLDVIFTGDSGTKLYMAFFFGILPETFFTYTREKLNLPGLPRRDHPLTKLEGIDLYDRSVLEQEGIVNVEGLAHHEFVDLLLNTRIPVQRLVDWVDQAILYLHVVSESEDPRNHLRRYGIRTATDFLLAWREADRRGELDAFKQLLPSQGNGKMSRLEVIRDALSDDEWLQFMLSWREEAPPMELKVDCAPEVVIEETPKRADQASEENKGSDNEQQGVTN